LKSAAKYDEYKTKHNSDQKTKYQDKKQNDPEAYLAESKTAIARGNERLDAAKEDRKAKKEAYLKEARENGIVGRYEVDHNGQPFKSFTKLSESDKVMWDNEVNAKVIAKSKWGNAHYVYDCTVNADGTVYKKEDIGWLLSGRNNTILKKMPDGTGYHFSTNDIGPPGSGKLVEVKSQLFQVLQNSDESTACEKRTIHILREKKENLEGVLLNINDFGPSKDPLGFRMHGSGVVSIKMVELLDAGVIGLNETMASTKRTELKNYLGDKDKPEYWIRPSAQKEEKKAGRYKATKKRHNKRRNENELAGLMLLNVSTVIQNL
jgi:hypothetical protein